MEVAKLTARGQITLPKRVRERLGVRAGDHVVFSLENDAVVVKRQQEADEDCLEMLEHTLSEWHSPEDEAAWRDL